MEEKSTAISLSISALDAESFEKWLKKGGGANLKKYIAEQMQQSSERSSSKSENLNEQLKKVQEALCQFIINATKENAPATRCKRCQRR